MATALFITTKDLKQNTLIDGSVDADKFIYFIKIAQEIHIQNYLGGALYNKISNLITNGTINNSGYRNYKNLIRDHLKDMLIHYAMVDYLPFAAFQVSNGGVFKQSSENSSTASVEEINTLVDRHREFAQFYTRRFIDFMNFNNSKFPEYNQNQNEDMYPDRDATFQGWVL
tara:strand:- start:2955 stop:3467 length:513 start_codon:yes stop_codon:yes gene_type:complete